MRKKITNRENLAIIQKCKSRFLKQQSFPPLPRPHESWKQPILYTGHLMFIRSKFLFLGMVDSLEDKNMYVYYSLLKSFWENVAAFGYYYLRISSLLEAGREEEAWMFAGKMGLGGRKFPTEEMVKKKGHTIEDFKLPNILTMMDVVDKDMKKRSKREGAVLRDLYEEQIAEGGHTTYTGLTIATKWSHDRTSSLPDLKKKWDRKDKGFMLNLAALSSIVFFLYWEKFEKL